MLESLDVALALGGGAARGLAHIGIIRELEAMGLRIRAVAGTSIGSVIGGVYCAGGLDDYEAFVRSLDARRMLRLLDPVFPTSGLLGGQRVMNELYGMLGHHAIESLDVPFVAVAADLYSGEEVRIASGDLVEAMRASWAIPGIFTPVELDGRWLVDGGVAAPVPLAAARELGDGLPVIAVNLNNSDLVFSGEILSLMESLDATRHPPKRMRRILERLRGRARTEPSIVSSAHYGLTHLEHRLTRFQVAADPPDLLLEPAVYGVGLFDFHHAPELIEAGVDVVRRAVKEDRFKELAAKARLRGHRQRWLRERPGTASRTAD